MEGVKLRATAADGARPLGAVAKLEAALLQVGGHRYRRLSVELARARGALTVDARVTPLLGEAGGGWREAGDLAAHLAGDLDPDERGFLMRELSIGYPEATWTLQEPARVTAGGETGIAADPLHLRSGTQEVTAAGRASRESVDAWLQVRRLDLGRLPAGWVDPALDLAGLVDAEVSARGPWVDPVASGNVRLQRGRVRRWDELDISLFGTYSDGRADGNLHFASPLGHLGATFNLPVMGPAQRRHERIEATVTMDEQPIAPLLAMAGWPERLTGTAFGTLALSGTADAPSARMDLTVRNLDAPQHPLPPQWQPTLTVILSADQGQGVQATATMAAAASTRGEVTVRTPFALADLLAHPPDRAEMMSAAGSVDVTLTDLPLEIFQAARDRHLHGRASFTANVTGTPRDPKVQASLEGGVDLEDEAARARSSPGAGSASRTGSSLVLTDLATRIVAQVRERWRALTDAGARDVKRSGPASECLPDDGALSDTPPKLLADAGAQPAGHAFVRGEVIYRYEAQRSTLVAHLASSGGGRARLDGTLGMDLSLPALLRGVDAEKAAVGATLRARDLELAVLRGSWPSVREIGGRLSANAQVARTADTSDAQGCMALRGGTLAIDEHGSYRAIQLRADALGKTIKISRLEAQSGSGYAELTADLMPAGGGAFRVTGTARSDAFPIIYRYQTHAAVSAQLAFQGDLSRSGVSLDRVEIQEARIQLPEDQLKELSGIGLPRDITLVDGEPAERHEEKAAGAEAPSWRHSLTVVKAQKVRLESPDLVNMEIDLSDGFHFEYAGSAAVTGTVRVAGQHAGIFLLGREFGLRSDSQLTFTSSLRYPELNITGDYVNEHEGVTVTMRALNKGKSIVLEPTSNPPLSVPEIFTLLATGRRVVKRGSCSSMCGADAATALGALLTTRFRNLLAKYLLLDVISIESGGGDGLKGMRFGAGWRFSNGLYAGVKVQVGADPLKGENTYEIYTEYPLTPDISLQTQYGDGNAGGADLVWSREY